MDSDRGVEDEQWYFCISDRSVRQGKYCSSLNRMGPYPNRETAEQALELAARRNKEADATEDSWND
ncbi:MAG: hypothetical protein ACRCSF_06475 [Mycobacteriaceae bacterium]